MSRLGAVRLGDWVIKYCKGKISGPFIRASKTTFVNGRGQVRIGDRSLPGRAITGSRSRFVDGRSVVRLKDKVVCGRISRASKDTFIGD